MNILSVITIFHMKTVVDILHIIDRRHCRHHLGVSHKSNKLRKEFRHIVITISVKYLVVQLWTGAFDVSLTFAVC